MDLGVSLSSRRALAVDRAAAWRLALGALVAANIVVRTWAAWQHSVPNYFPDEYIYSSISRSLAAGHLPAVRGHFAAFPALLQPLATAPAWWFGSLETGYRITQAIDVVAMSTAALATWWLARIVGVSRGLAFTAAALSIAVPDMFYSGWILSEPFSYPLFVAALAAGTLALARPTRRHEALFVAFAVLAVFARLQLVVMIPAYLAAALLLRRLRMQKLALAGLVAVGALVGAAVLGFYHKASVGMLSPAELGRNLFVLAFAAGWIIVPAALIGLADCWLRPRGPAERAFGVLALTAGAGVIAEATLYGDRTLVHERYDFYVLPLLFVAFALHAARGWPRPRVHALLALAMLALASTVTLAGWLFSHSLLLVALRRFEKATHSAGTGSLYVALLVGALSLVSIGLAWRRLTAVVAALAFAFLIAASCFVLTFDRRNSQETRAVTLPNGPDWIAGPATVVLDFTNRSNVIQQLFWNRGAKQLALLPGADAPDQFPTAQTRIASDGRLAGLSGRVVLDENGNALLPAQPLRRNGRGWVEAATPQLVAELGGRTTDNWLSQKGVIRLFRPGRLTFTVTSPGRQTLKIAGRTLHLRGGTPTQVSVCTLGASHYRFSTHGWVGLREVSAETSFPTFRAGARCGRE